MSSKGRAGCQASGRVPLAPCPRDDAQGWPARHPYDGASSDDGVSSEVHLRSIVTRKE